MLKVYRKNLATIGIQIVNQRLIIFIRLSTKQQPHKNNQIKL